MALAFDAQSFLDFTTSNSWTHTPAATPRLVVVMIAQEGNADQVSAVTYGGIALQRVMWVGTNSAETGGVYIYWSPLSMSAAKTVAVTVSAGTTAKTGWAVTFTGAATTRPGNVRLVSWASIFAQDAASTFANPTVTLGTRSSFAGAVCNVIFSGLAAPDDVTLAPLNTATSLTGSAAGGRDFGTDAAKATYKIASGAAVTSGYTSAADDVAMVAAAFEELNPLSGRAGQALVDTANYPVT